VRLCRSKLPVPVVLVNYDGFYSSLMDFLRACDRGGTVGAAELHNVVVAADNEEVGSPDQNTGNNIISKGNWPIGSHLHGMSRVWFPRDHPNALRRLSRPRTVCKAAFDTPVLIRQVLGCLARFYGLPWDKATEVRSASAWLAKPDGSLISNDKAGLAPLQQESSAVLEAAGMDVAAATAAAS